MPKKIKELTKEEIEKICNNKVYMFCLGCPLNTNDFGMCIKDYIFNKKRYEDKLEEEIEVQDYAKEKI